MPPELSAKELENVTKVLTSLGWKHRVAANPGVAFNLPDAPIGGSQKKNTFVLLGALIGFERARTCLLERYGYERDYEYVHPTPVGCYVAFKRKKPLSVLVLPVVDSEGRLVSDVSDNPFLWIDQVIKGLP